MHCSCGNYARRSGLRLEPTDADADVWPLKKEKFRNPTPFFPAPALKAREREREAEAEALTAPMPDARCPTPGPLFSPRLSMWSGLRLLPADAEADALTKNLEIRPH